MVMNFSNIDFSDLILSYADKFNLVSCQDRHNIKKQKQISSNNGNINEGRAIDRYSKLSRNPVTSFE
jgi:hypothetical protein